MQVAPSILSANFLNLENDIEMINGSEATMIHVDVMDGIFVPNISIGFPVIQAVAKIARKPLDVHLMIEEPSKYVTRLRDCGAAIMNVHQEACRHLDRTLNEIKQAGMKAAVTLNPATPVTVLEDVIELVDMVLLMSVNPGFAGQKYIPYTTTKLQRLRDLIARSNSHALIEVDGGINLDTGRQAAEAGADILVAGQYIFGSTDPRATIAQLSKL